MENGEERVKDVKYKMRWSYMHLIKGPISRDKRKWVYKVISEEIMSNFSGIMNDTVHRDSIGLRNPSRIIFNYILTHYSKTAENARQ